MKKALIAVLTMVTAGVLLAEGQTCDIRWDASLYGAGATSEALPFWAVTGKNGVFPDSRSAFVVAGADLVYETAPGVDIYAGMKFSGFFTPAAFSGVNSSPVIKGFLPSERNGSVAWNAVLNELYVGAGWKMLRLDLGIADREPEYGGLSLTGGDIVWSGNSRSMPGYNLQVNYFEVPGTRGIFSVKANYADYKMIDDRYVDGPMLHNKSLFFKFRLFPRLHLQLGLEQWSMWGGISPVNGPQPATFNDYLRVVCGMRGGSDATESDQVNVLGDHRGRELIRLDWEGDAFTVSFAHDIPFEDGSGMGFQNFPDGVNTLFFSFKDRKKWVADILYEFVYTKWQSGPYHDTGADPDRQDEEWHVLGGCDNYFNNGEYKSGWTCFGRTAGLPLFTPVPVSEDGTVLGICNNRVVAHHLGIGGMLGTKVPYRLKATYSRNYGLYYQTLPESPGSERYFFDSVPWQLSLALELDIPRFVRNLPVSLSIGAYGDIGELYEDSFGLILKISCSGRFRHGKS